MIQALALPRTRSLYQEGSPMPLFPCAILHQDPGLQGSFAQLPDADEFP